ncbi:adenine phosphoribosyltransferase [Conidiobolus coronatus NRRL 28638]|uniref:adenine phosphoribosyltransferase n=1 Tax=Conidiobolus coronatus (strain ATCC 28846 / CBS 209.66 / NRRL 28638) TaxID=796925 RepID=A0A137P406_CONC2|nr:adenine phosphoribosyltransferase [Conidiobolus coronatus NRRL 28638]|eukprot:KXN69733.1 adenine phosphoribosyltransferase [Conidiobolus coronatus NRRL 28638]
MAQKVNHDIERLKEKITAIPDFPQPGIIFRDIFPIFQDPIAVESLLTHITHHITSSFEKKGFLFGPLIAIRLGAAFVPVRKSGKLPGATIKAEYTKEYGVDVFEMQENAIKPGQNVIIIDDLIATGGSAFAAAELVKKSSGNILEYIFVIELEDLQGSKKLEAPVYSLVKY